MSALFGTPGRGGPVVIFRRRPSEPDDTWLASASAALERFSHLDRADRERVLAQAWELDGTRSWEPLDGLTLTPAMRAAIAAPACVLTLAIGIEWFGDVTAVLVEPRSSARSTRRVMGGGIVSEGTSHVLGQALIHGPVRLAWNEIEDDARSPLPKSVVLHEFAHKLDMADGVVDGNPNVRPRATALTFEQVLDETLDRLRLGPYDGPIRSYGATNRSELFAVATESFFLAPVELLESDPSVYAVLSRFYEQDPASARS